MNRIALNSTQKWLFQISSSSVSHGLLTRRTKLLKSFKLQYPNCPYFSSSFKNPFTFLNIKKCCQNGKNCWNFLAKILQRSSGKRKELRLKNKPYKSTLFLTCVINTISYTIHFKDALAQVFFPPRAHILAWIVLFVLWNSKCPVWFIWFLCGGWGFFLNGRRRAIPWGLMIFKMPQNKFWDIYSFVASLDSKPCSRWGTFSETFCWAKGHSYLWGDVKSSGLYTYRVILIYELWSIWAITTEPAHEKSLLGGFHNRG